MLHHCPSCQRSFDEPGFCPFDRTELVGANAAAVKQTVLSVAMPAQPSTPPASTPPADAPYHPTQVERRGTLPLTPAPTSQITTQHARARSETGPESKVRAVSASDSASEALETFRHQRETEYDRLVGQTLDGRYYVEKKIGEGGMGVVFSARHAVIERPLAIKVLKREVMRDTATIKRFVQEAKAASRIGHPNIVDVTDFGTTPDGMTYSVMEFVVGQTLGVALRATAPFPALRAIKIAAQIARALGAAHDKGITHRDLKPENVFLTDRDGRTDFVKIVDFGIAKVTPIEGSPHEPRLTRAGSVFGTPEYMAPEQAAGKGDTDGRVDIYALGVILYEMVCGRVPHRGDTMVRTLAMQMLDPAEPPSKVRPDLGIHPELETVIMKALAKKRENRYQTMGELLVALDKVHTVIGQSVTGSPVYALAPLPPGADPDTTVAPAAGPAARPVSRSVSPTDAPRSKSPTNQRLRHEPQFTSGDRPQTYEHVWTVSDLPARSRRWPLLLVGVLALGGVGVAIALVMKARVVAEPPARLDAGIVQVPTADATIAEVVDAGAPDDAPLDGTDIVVVHVHADAGVRIRPPRRDAGTGPGPTSIPETPNRRGTIMVQVITKPEGATLYAGTSYRGPGGATLEEPFGSKLGITCRLKGYKEGQIEIAFDGKTEVVLCVLERIKVCVDGLKNVFDDCEPRD